MSELFDPARHRVFAVDRTYSYRAYVVAATAEEAEATAEAHNDDDRDLATMATASCVTQKLAAPLGDSEETLPWRPARWGRRWPTVKQGLELVTNPRTVPAVTSPGDAR